VLPVINAIWIGSKLGQIHVACLRSFLRQGHRVVLHCYERPADTPTEVEIADARNLLPESRIIRYRGTGSFALFSNLLRYEILKAGLGIYVDCDVYCLRPIEDAEYIFGREGILKGSSINNAVLELPRHCPALAALSAIKDARDFVPPWEKVRRRPLQWLRGPAAVTPLEDLPWGTTGPRALSYYAEKYGISRYASPVDRFYPVPWVHLELLFDPGLSLGELITHRTDAVHLYNNNQIKRLPEDIGLPKGSPIWEMVFGG